MLIMNSEICWTSFFLLTVALSGGESAAGLGSDFLRAEIQTYAPIVQKIFKYVVDGGYKNVTYDSLADFTDRFGSRLAGTRNLEDSIDFILEKSKELGLENVRGEDVQVPHWERGYEAAYLLSPRKTEIKILGLGHSIGTPPEGLTADVVVVDSFEELERLNSTNTDAIKGKILVFNEAYVWYGVTVEYRGRAAVEAGKYGAVATLVRSVAPFSINSPHTGSMNYAENVTKVPVACISIEAAEMLRRMVDRGSQVTIKLIMNAKEYDPETSRNVIAEIGGFSKPLEQVIISGHIDSWDVGQGAMDDGGGAFISWHSLIVLKNLGLRPRRTIRGILWTAEEWGYVGAKEYLNRHRSDLEKINFVMESDGGTFTPLGLEVAASDAAATIIQEILNLMGYINATQIKRYKSVGSDIELFINEGIPAASLLNDNERYFWFHHSEGDMMTVQNPQDMDKCTALWAAVAYVIADLKDPMPRR